VTMTRFPCKKLVSLITQFLFRVQNPCQGFLTFVSLIQLDPGTCFSNLRVARRVIGLVTFGSRASVVWGIT